MSSNLFKPLNVGRSVLDNRIALAALTRLRSPNHIPGNDVVEYYRQRSVSPGTLLLTEATSIAVKASGYPNAPGIWSDEQIEAWKKVTSAVHDNKSFIYLQLWALGRQAPAAVLEADGYKVHAPSAIPMGPSFIAPNGGDMPYALTVDEIKEYVSLYAQAAKNAIAAGFDGVEIHGANGYLIDEFLHANSNTRTDEYGGSIENRSRFGLEVVDAVSEAIGADRTAIRLSPWGEFGDVDPGVSPIPQWSYFVEQLETRALAGKRLAFIDLMEPRADLSSDEAVKLPRHLNNFVRDIWQGIIMRGGCFGHLVDDMTDMTEKDDKLLVAVGRHFISNPDLVEKIKANKPLDNYDRNTFYWDGKADMATGYTRDYIKIAA